MAVQISVRIRGARLVAAGLAALRTEDIPNVVAKDVYAMMLRARRRVATYPPPPPESTYERTGRYGRGFQIRRREPRTGARGGVLPEYTLFNRVTYTVWVGGNAYGQMQARVHQDRWPVIREVIEDEISKLPPDLQQHMALVARRRGFQAEAVA